MSHDHQWIELGRVFPFAEGDHALDYLSPEGLHDPETGELVRPDKMKPKLREHFESKVPLPSPHVILQCEDADCPDGPKHTIHVELKADEWKRLKAALEAGDLDPDGNDTNRLVSQGSLDQLGLGRIARMLTEKARASSGAAEIAGLV